MNIRYSLITSAYNEELFIKKTIDSVVKQTVLPVRWTIVSDGSTDSTDDIINKYCFQYPFIKYFKIHQNTDRGTLSKVGALIFAFKSQEDLDCDYIGNLDADVSFESNYFASLISRFDSDLKLGIVGGMIHEVKKGKFQSRMSNSPRSVAHAAQLVRLKCWNDIGGYTALKYGGEDWYAEIAAKMHGWTVRSFRELKVNHHRKTGEKSRTIDHRFREGKMDYSMGSYLLFELLKCVKRIPEHPFFIGACLRFMGFLWSGVQNEDRAVASNIILFVRREQKERIKLLLNR